MNRKGIELSINFIVIIIIATAVLGLSLVVLGNIFNQGLDLLENIDQNAKADIDRQLNAGAWIAVSPSRFDIARKESYPVWIGVRNKDSQGDFSLVLLSYSTCEPADSSGSCTPVPFGYEGIGSPINLKKGETAYFAALIKTPASINQPGTYVVKATVHDETGNIYPDGIEPRFYLFLE